MIKKFSLFENKQNYDTELIDSLLSFDDIDYRMSIFTRYFKYVDEIDINEGSFESLTMKKILDDKIIEISWKEYHILSFLIKIGKGVDSVVMYIIKNFMDNPNVEIVESLLQASCHNASSTLPKQIIDLPNFDPSFDDDMLLDALITSNRLDEIKTILKDDRVNVNNYDTLDLIDIIEYGMDDILEVILPHKEIEPESISGLYDILMEADMDTFKIVIENMTLPLDWDGNNLLKKCVLYDEIEKIKYLMKKTGISRNYDAETIRTLTMHGILPSYTKRKIKR